MGNLIHRLISSSFPTSSGTQPHELPPTGMDDLPSEIIVIILSKLESVERRKFSRVCKRWQTILQTNLLATELLVHLPLTSRTWNEKTYMSTYNRNSEELLTNSLLHEGIRKIVCIHSANRYRSRTGKRICERFVGIVGTSSYLLCALMQSPHWGNVSSVILINVPFDLACRGDSTFRLCGLNAGPQVATFINCQIDIQLWARMTILREAPRTMNNFEVFEVVRHRMTLEEENLLIGSVIRIITSSLPPTTQEQNVAIMNWNCLDERIMKFHIEVNLRWMLDGCDLNYREVMGDLACIDRFKQELLYRASGIDGRYREDYVTSWLFTKLRRLSRFPFNTDFATCNAMQCFTKTVCCLTSSYFKPHFLAK